MVSEQTDASALAGRYATALFQLAVENSSVDTVEQELTQIQLMIDQSNDLRRVIRSPLFTLEEQSIAMAALCKEAKFSLFVSNLIGVLSRNRRLFAVESIVEEFRKLLSEYRGEVEAEIITAVELTDKQRLEIQKALKSATGFNIAIVEKLDTEILGGMIIRVGSRMVDFSLRTKLQKLKLAMKGAA